MEFAALAKELGETIGAELDGSSGAVGLEVDGQTVILQLAGGARGDILFMHADLGELPHERRHEFMKAVLGANFLFQGTGGATFALNEANGHLILQRYDWLDRMDAQVAIDSLDRFAGTIASWKSIMADCLASAAKGDDSLAERDSAADIIGGSFLPV